MERRRIERVIEELQEGDEMDRGCDGKAAGVSDWCLLPEELGVDCGVMG